MNQVTTPTESKQTSMVRVWARDQDRMDSLALQLEKERGGSWSRAHVTEVAMDALERERAAAQSAQSNSINS